MHSRCSGFIRHRHYQAPRPFWRQGQWFPCILLGPVKQRTWYRPAQKKISCPPFVKKTLIAENVKPTLGISQRVTGIHRRWRLNVTQPRCAAKTEEIESWQCGNWQRAWPWEPWRWWPGAVATHRAVWPAVSRWWLVPLRWSVRRRRPAAMAPRLPRSSFLAIRPWASRCRPRRRPLMAVFNLLGFL